MTVGDFLGYGLSPVRRRMVHPIPQDGLPAFNRLDGVFRVVSESSSQVHWAAIGIVQFEATLADDLEIAISHRYVNGAMS